MVQAASLNQPRNEGFATMDSSLTRKASQVAPGSNAILVR